MQSLDKSIREFRDKVLTGRSVFLDNETARAVYMVMMAMSSLIVQHGLGGFEMQPLEQEKIAEETRDEMRDEMWW